MFHVERSPGSPSPWSVACSAGHWALPGLWRPTRWRGRATPTCVGLTSLLRSTGPSGRRGCSTWNA